MGFIVELTSYGNLVLKKSDKIMTIDGTDALGHEFFRISSCMALMRIYRWKDTFTRGFLFGIN